MLWYVDGVQVSAKAVSLPAGTGTDPLVIGQGDNPGKDALDEVAVYASALPPARIQAHVTAVTAA